MQGNSHCVESLLAAAPDIEHVGMRAEDIGKFTVETDRSISPLVRGKSVHAGDDRTGRVCKTNRHADMIHPVVEHGCTPGTHTVALVAVIPSGDGGMVLHLLNEILHEPRLPHNSLRIDKNVALFKHRRHKLAARHPACHNSNNELDVMLLRHIAEQAETLHHLVIHTGPVGERLVVLEPVAAVVATCETVACQRLEIAPQRKHPHHSRSVAGKSFKLLICDIRTPLAPHIHTGVLRPVVAPHKELAIREYVTRSVV